MRKLLGKGYMGKVYLTDRQTAIKIGRLGKEEANIGKKAGELGIGPKVIRFSDSEIEMEFINGSSGATEILRALSLLHLNGIAHRDLAPKNVLLSHTDKVYIIDYGKARLGFDYVVKELAGTGIKDGEKALQAGLRKSAMREKFYEVRAKLLLKLKAEGDRAYCKKTVEWFYNLLLGSTNQYRELQRSLKVLRAKGLTTIKLNVKKAILQAEFDRISSTYGKDLINKNLLDIPLAQRYY